MAFCVLSSTSGRSTIWSSKRSACEANRKRAFRPARSCARIQSSLAATTIHGAKRGGPARAERR
eukprot:4901602-Pyramimonas_sp.AAC.1